MNVRHRRTAAAVVIAAAAVAGALAPTLANAAPTTTPVNGTAHNHLTISNGTPWVVMNGTRVNFGTDVRDLAWNPSGTKAAFIDSYGNLDVANPNGSGRVVVAKNPGGQTWSHPTWQVAKADHQVGIPAKDNLIFVATKHGVSRLEKVSATAHHGTPVQLPLGQYAGAGTTANPTAGNNWPNAGGSYGTIVYSNAHTGDVYIRDDYIRQQGGVLTPGSEPALSPSGDEVVFVRSVAGHDHIFEENLNSSKPTAVDITPRATVNFTEPTFSPDGSRIAFRTPTGIATVGDHGRGSVIKVSGYVGLPAYRA